MLTPCVCCQRPAIVSETGMCLPCMIALAETPAEEQRETIEFLRGPVTDFHHPDSAPYMLTAQGWEAIGQTPMALCPTCQKGLVS